MPTLNWILDSDRDRFNAAFPMPTSYTRDCPFCAREFIGDTLANATRRVMAHVAKDHPIASPLLSIQGRIAGSRVVIGRQLAADGIALLNCQHIEASVDGTDWPTVDPAELRP